MHQSFSRKGCPNYYVSGLDGIVCQMDDVLIFGRIKKDEHDIRLMKALDRIHSAGVTLNREKCLFGQDSLKFLGHVVNKSRLTVVSRGAKKKQAYTMNE